jgi:hypothetical protein
MDVLCSSFLSLIPIFVLFGSNGCRLYVLSRQILSQQKEVIAATGSYSRGALYVPNDFLLQTAMPLL